MYGIAVSPQGFAEWLMVPMQDGCCVSSLYIYIDAGESRCTVVLLFKVPQKRIHYWQRSIRQQSEFICVFIGKIARWHTY